MDKKTITVVAVDDHALILEAIRTRLGQDSGIALVAEGTVGEQVLPLVAAHRPDVLLLDLRMPQRVGDRAGTFPYLDTVATLAHLYPHTRIIVLSQHAIAEEVAEIARIGIQGYLLKSDTLSLKLAEVVRKATAGDMVFSQKIEAMLGATPHSERLNFLTVRQRQVLWCKLENLDKSNRELADILHISESAFKGHLTNVYRLLGVKNTAEASNYYGGAERLVRPESAPVVAAEAKNGTNSVRGGFEAI
jgi:DNA-binding NarL/FixJ family response regulator